MDLSRNSKDPFNEFLNIEMEKLRGNLISNINVFLYYKSNNTFVEYIGGKRMCVTNLWLSNHQSQDGRDVKLIKEFEKDAEKLNELATTVWESYCEFVRYGRRLLFK